jgi:hypothetical protein
MQKTHGNAYAFRGTYERSSDRLLQTDSVCAVNRRRNRRSSQSVRERVEEQRHEDDAEHRLGQNRRSGLRRDGRDVAEVDRRNRGCAEIQHPAELIRPRPGSTSDECAPQADPTLLNVVRPFHDAAGGTGTTGGEQQVIDTAKAGCKVGNISGNTRTSWSASHRLHVRHRSPFKYS